MCLYNNKIIIESADKDISIYKILQKNPNTGGWITPIMEHPVEINQMLYSSHVIKITGNWDLFEISEGVIHCYKDLITSKEKFDILNEFYPGHSYGLFKAIIPKGQKYIIGKNNEIGAFAIIVKDLLYFCQNGEIVKTN